MSITAAFVLFAVSWFLVFLIVLPLRVVTQADIGTVVPGTHAGAPAEENVKRKALIATGVAVVVWAIAYFVITSGMITIRDIDIMNVMPPPRSFD